jgi:prepilin-type N-terminal cleavage/methylation domain-containing protein
MIKRFKAFTLIELMMTLLISSVVIGIVYYAFLVFNKQFSGYQVKSAAMNEYLIFQKALGHDMDVAEYMENSGQDGLLLYATPGHAPIEYRFNKNCITRVTETATDSFTILNSNYRVQYVNDSSTLVNTVLLNITIDHVDFSKLFTKDYSMCQLMKYERQL